MGGFRITMPTFHLLICSQPTSVWSACLFKASGRARANKASLKLKLGESEATNKQTNKTRIKTEKHKGDGLMEKEGRKRSVIIVHQSSVDDLFLSAASASTQFRFPHISWLYLPSTH